MSISRAPESRDDSGARARFRAWRAGRPFWGVLLSIVGAIELYLVTQAQFAVVVMQGLTAVTTIAITLLTIILGVVTWRQPELRSITGWIILIMGLASLLVSNLGGFLVGMILMLIGSSLILAWQPAELVYDDYDDEYDEYDDAEYDDDAEYEDSGDVEYTDSDVTDDVPAAATDSALTEPQDADELQDVEEPAPPTRRRRFLGSSRTSLRTVTAAVLPILAIAFSAQLLTAGPASAAALASGVQTSAAPDWWPFSWDPFPKDDPAPTPTPAPTATTPAAPSPVTPAATATQPPLLPLPQITLPGATPTAPATPAPGATATLPPAAAGATCDQQAFPDTMPAVGTAGATQAATALQDCVAAQAAAPAADAPVTPADTGDGNVLVSGEISTLYAKTLTLNGFAYDGVQTLQTKKGPIKVLAFSMDTIAVEGHDQTWPSADGEARLQNLSGNAEIKGNVKLYVTKMTGKAFGLLELTFSVDSPPPITLPFLLFTEATSDVVLVQADQVLVPQAKLTVK